MTNFRGRRARTVFWTIGIIAALLVAGMIALQMAIARNGPAVLDAIDRLTAGDRGVAVLTEAELGQHPRQAVTVFGVNGAGPAGEDNGRLPVILFIHGGSWASGDPDDYSFIARSLAPEGFIVAIAGYRLHPEVVYPAMLEDAASAIAWTHANIERFGGDPARITLVGHSAGAYNAVMTVLDDRWLAPYGLGAEAIAGIVGLAGPYDFYPFDSDSSRASFGSAENPQETQPVNFVSGADPPLLLIHGELDTTVKPRNSRRLEELVREAGGTVSAHYFAEMDHRAPLLALASPWRRDPTIHDLVVHFARKAKASVPVQAETR